MRLSLLLIALVAAQKVEGSGLYNWWHGINDTKPTQAENGTNERFGVIPGASPENIGGCRGVKI
jgi:hypothetical protein